MVVLVPRLLWALQPSLRASDAELQSIASKLKLEIFDLDEGVFGLNSKDMDFSIHVVRCEVKTSPSLGLELMEMAAASDGRGLVLVSGTSGNAAETDLRPGDALTLARGRNLERLTALDYDRTIAGIRRACDEAETVVLEANRLVRRATIEVDYSLGGDGGERGTVRALAGENLRRVLIRSGIELYDPRTKRFDQPYATGDCKGEGLCGTCLVAVDSGQESLSVMGAAEKVITKCRPLTWRAACRCVVGADNNPATISLRLTPQSGFAEELAPKVRPLGLEADA